LVRIAIIIFIYVLIRWTFSLNISKPNIPDSYTEGWANANYGQICLSFNSGEQTAKYFTVGFGGASNTTQSAISLYSDRLFRENELFFDGTELSLPLEHSTRTWIFTGEQNWALFTESDFKGEEICAPVHYFSGQFLGISSSNDVTMNGTKSIRSIRKGCSEQSATSSHSWTAGSKMQRGENYQWSSFPEGVQVDIKY